MYLLIIGLSLSGKSGNSVLTRMSRNYWRILRTDTCIERCWQGVGVGEVELITGISKTCLECGGILLRWLGGNHALV